MNHKSLYAAIALCGTIVFGGCGGDVDARGQRVPISGTVTLDGEPLSRARIRFASDAGNGAVNATALIENGKFSMSHMNGPLPGTARVEIHPEIIDLEEMEAARGGDRFKKIEAKAVEIPPRYNVRSELTAQVAAEGENVFTFALISK